MLTMQSTNPWESELLHAFSTEQGQSRTPGLYPTPPPSVDGLDSLHFPIPLGLTQSPTPMLYHASIVNDEHIQEDLTDDSDIVMSVSTSFHPGSYTMESDLISSSSDGVLFYLHSDIINNVSPSALASFLSYSTPGVADTIVHIPEPATILNIILHAVYQTCCALNSPSIDDLLEAVNKMPQYGIQPSTCIRPPLPLYTLLLSHAPLHPIDIYALAAYHELSDLAVHASSHLLGFPLDTIDDATAARIGPSYLRRLFLLHMNRVAAVKTILLQPPSLHPASKACSFEEQKRLTRAWALGSTYLVWDVRPDLSNQRIQSVFEPLGANLSCTACEEMLKRRIRDVLVSWAAVKCTISAPPEPQASFMPPTPRNK